MPSLISGEGGGTLQGGEISLRGVEGADVNPFGDQAVSFNIDGVQVAKASIRRMGQMDVGQIEVLNPSYSPGALLGAMIAVAGAIDVGRPRGLAACSPRSIEAWRG